MDNYFSIGEMAQIHNVSVQTLRYYESIGLFEPSYVDKYSGYRYYSIDQFSHLDVIKYLKYLGMPLKDIKRKLNGNNQEIMELIEEKIDMVDHKISELELIKRILQNKMNILKDGESQNEVGKIYKKHFKERNILSIKLRDGYSYNDIELIRREIGTILENNLGIFNGGVSGLASMERVKNSGKVIYESSFVFVIAEMVNDNTKKYITTVPEGEYLCIRYKGDYGNNYVYFKNLIDYVVNSGLVVKDEMYEIPIVDPFSTRNKDELLTEIQIRIEK